MPLPPSATTVQVFGTYLDHTGAPLGGSVQFRASTWVTVGGVALGPHPVTVQLDSNGHFSISLVATDDPDVTPTGWTWRASLDIAGCERVIDFALPQAGGPVDLTTVAPVQVVTPTATVVRTVGGVGPDSTGNVPINVGGGGGGGAVSSVNGRTGAVVLGAADVAAAPASRRVSAGSGLTGGGDLSADRTLALADATSTAQGGVRLAGDLSGTASAPTVPGLASKVSTVSAADATIVMGGTPTAPTVAVGVVAEAQVTGLVTDLAGKVPASTVTAKGDLLVATGAGAIGRLAVGSNGQVPLADSTQPTGIRWGAVVGGMDQVYPLAGYGLVAAADNPQLFGGNSGIVSDGSIWLTRVWVPANTGFSRIALAVRAGGTYSATGKPNRLAWFTDAGVLQDQTPDDSTMWATSQAWSVGTLTSAVPAQGNGRFVYIGVICGGYSNVSPAWNDARDADVAGKIPGGTQRRTMFRTGQSALPATFDPTAYGTATNYMPLVGLLP